MWDFIYIFYILRFNDMIRKLALGIFIFGCIFWFLVYQDRNFILVSIKNFRNQNKLEPELNDKYLVLSRNCKIPNLDPFSDDGKKNYKLKNYNECSNMDLLTYIKKTDNIVTLHINHQVLPLYSRNRISCCYSNVTRENDNKIGISNCKTFVSNVTIHNEVIMVHCTDLKMNRQVYKNVHASIKINKNVEQRLATFKNNSKPLSVLILGIDNISRLNFIRHMPSTYKYVKDNNWATLKGYNKIDENTFPNFMAILAGYNQSYSYLKCNPLEEGELDKCPLLWNDFRRFGYVTAYAEDAGEMSAFSYGKTGFVDPPVDYYMRPYVLAYETLNIKKMENMIYCAGPETSGERILNVAKDFLTTFQNYPQFSLFWMNSFSHSSIYGASRLDDKVKIFLENLKNSGVLENVIVIFLSDHGIRFGKIRLTQTGWFEERLPFIFVSFPEWFKQQYAEEYGNFLTNEYRLTSPFDLHLTLKEILVMSGYVDKVRPTTSCSTCRSLFQSIDIDRSCEEAGIGQHWCTCLDYQPVKLNEEIDKMLANFVIEEISINIRKYIDDGNCMKFIFDRVISTKISRKLSYKNTTHILITFKTIPAAVFESTVMYKGMIQNGDYYLANGVSRLDYYGSFSKCISEVSLKKYCYCVAQDSNYH